MGQYHTKEKTEFCSIILLSKPYFSYSRTGLGNVLKKYANMYLYRVKIGSRLSGRDRFQR